MVAAYPSGSNTFVRDHDASGKLVVDYSRNIKDFAINQWAQIIPVKKVAGYYMKMTVEEAGRIIAADGADFVWADGQPAREGNDGTESFDFQEFLCTRYQYPVMLGDLSVENASWDIIAQHCDIKTRQAMTNRTDLASAIITTAGNHDAGHTSAVASITGNTGTWANSTTARSDIKRSLNHAGETILDATLGAVNLDDLIIVVSSAGAKTLTESQEVIDYIKGSPDALAQIRGELPGNNKIYGLPDHLFGFPVVIEKTRKVTTQKGFTTVRAQVWPATSCAMVARPGGLVGVADSPNFASVCGFMYEEMTVERKRDDDNRRTQCRVVENYVYKLVSTASSYLFTTIA